MYTLKNARHSANGLRFEFLDIFGNIPWISRKISKPSAQFEYGHFNYKFENVSLRKEYQCIQWSILVLSRNSFSKCNTPSYGRKLWEQNAFWSTCCATCKQ